MLLLWCVGVSVAGLSWCNHSELHGCLFLWQYLICCVSCIFIPNITDLKCWFEVLGFYSSFVLTKLSFLTSISWLLFFILYFFPPHSILSTYHPCNLLLITQSRITIKQILSQTHSRIEHVFQTLPLSGLSPLKLTFDLWPPVTPCIPLYIYIYISRAHPMLIVFLLLTSVPVSCWSERLLWASA